MFQFNIDPVLFNFGNLEIRYYGLVYFFGVLFVYWHLKNKKVMDKEELEKFMLYLVVGMFLGARLLGLLSQNWNPFTNPIEFFKVWDGGMSFFGGFLGGFIGSYIVLKKRTIEIGDYVVVPVSFVLIFGRLANFTNQELIGRISDVSWCFEFSNYFGCRHPYTLYAALGHLVLFLVVYFVSRKNYRRGKVLFTFIIGYGIMRFITDFFRENPLIFGLTGWQYFSISFVIVGIYLLKKIKR